MPAPNHPVPRDCPHKHTRKKHMSNTTETTEPTIRQLLAEAKRVMRRDPDRAKVLVQEAIAAIDTLGLIE
jgi:hypothetical protein